MSPGRKVLTYFGMPGASPSPGPGPADTLLRLVLATAAGGAVGGLVVGLLTLAFGDGAPVRTGVLGGIAFFVVSLAVELVRRRRAVVADRRRGTLPPTGP